MIPIEFLWLALIVVFGLVGMARGLYRELGVTTILLLSLFVLKFAWVRLVDNLLPSLDSQMPGGTLMAAYYIVTIIFVAYISYEGFSLTFPIRQTTGFSKGLLGLPGGLLNGYLIVGTIWDVLNQAEYLGFQLPLGSTGETIAISNYLTPLHNMLVQYMPVTFVNEFVMLTLGMILLLAIVLK
ncbi:MAG: hypothetical protein PVF47_11920 [Anaerolineae bacterium]|jgi:uncharacterized membrane protein required for colicin V production